jgi:hypothetical protein
MWLAALFGDALVPGAKSHSTIILCLLSRDRQIPILGGKTNAGKGDLAIPF